MLSLSIQYYQILLAQGFCMGLGSSMLWTPCLAAVAARFVERRTLALTLAATGSGVGEFRHS